MFLKVEDLTAHYGHVRALDGVTVQAEKGSIVTLIGANGAGKSSFMMCLSGVLRPTSGTIEFDGTRIDKAQPERIVSLGLSQCPEGRRVWPKMTVLENLEMGAISVKDKKLVEERVEWAYGFFPILGERRGQLAGSLSGGEQQMLAIGRAIMSKPELLLLDEPSMGLAPLVVEGIADAITQLNKMGITVFLSEQNAQIALMITRHGYVMENGHLVLEGLSKDLITNEKVRKAYLGT